jgi:hypothetical protein
VLKRDRNRDSVREREKQTETVLEIETNRDSVRERQKQRYCMKEIERETKVFLETYRWKVTETEGMM